MTRRGAATAATAAFAALAGLGACLSIPPYQSRNGVSVADDATGSTVAGPRFALHFAGGAGFHFPDALTIDGHDVLGHEAQATCFDQDEAGVLIFPTPRISAITSAPAVRNQLAPALRGPAVVQMRLDWTTQFGCNTTRAPGGTSVFTVFPDGRIVRHETLEDPRPDDNVSSHDCACDPSGRDQGFTISSYWTFARAAFQNAFYYTEQLTLPLPMMMESDVTNFDTVCLDGPGYHLTSTWFTPLPTDTTAVHGGKAVFGHGMIKAIGTSGVELPWTTRSTLAIGRIDCRSAFRTALAYAAPAVLRVNGGDTTVARDGIYGGDPGTGEPGLALSTRHVELTGEITTPFAVWLTFPGPVELLRATRAGQTGEWYIPQQVNDRTWIVWFRDPLTAGQTITIDPG
ncbi:MAG TPA: hypothetical protein VGD37_30685 [Kofleriaceae bacterium]